MMGVFAHSASLTIRRPVPSEQSAIEALLAAARLPTEGVAQYLGDFFVVDDAGSIIGAIGVEPYGAFGMLRSLVVQRQRRGQGLGVLLTQRLLDDVDARGLTAVYLLATTAVTFFPRFGFVDIEREEVPLSVQSSRDFQDTGPASAVVMRRTRPG